MAQLALVHADPWLLVVDKPPGLLSQPGLGPHLQDSLLGRVQRQWPTAQLVHRLDRDTSGLLVLALDPLSHRNLSLQFQQRRVRKAYLAEVQGEVPGCSGQIDAPLARLSSQPPRYGVVPEGKPAFTRWRLLVRGPGWSRLLLQPRTGRSHQLRVHMAWLGHPILGDPLYGPASPGRMRLHAWGLQLRHPHSGERLRLRCAGHWGES